MPFLSVFSSQELSPPCLLSHAWLQCPITIRSIKERDPITGICCILLAWTRNNKAYHNMEGRSHLLRHEQLYMLQTAIQSKSTLFKVLKQDTLKTLCISRFSGLEGHLLKLELSASRTWGLDINSDLTRRFNRTAFVLRHPCFHWQLFSWKVQKGWEATQNAATLQSTPRMWNAIRQLSHSVGCHYAWQWQYCQSKQKVETRATSESKSFLAIACILQ